MSYNRDTSSLNKLKRSSTQQLVS